MKSVSLWDLFGVFVKVGTFTIGGGPAMLPVIEQEMIRRGWIPPEEFQDLVVLAQSAPGLLATNIAIFTGYRIRGFKGSVTAAAGATLPSLVIILLIAIFFTRFRENAFFRRFFLGVRPVAVALILVPGIRLARSSCKSWWTWLITFAALVGVAFLNISPAWIILTTLCSAIGISLLKQKRQ